MTDNDIIKALECCFISINCDGCYFNARVTDDICETVLGKEALDLINRQKAEIERLSELERGCYVTGYKNIRAEAITEFAERLCEGRVSNDPVVIAVKTELKMMKEGE